jgi:hypothetical protein
MPTQAPVATFQGIEVPATAINPAAFFALTRRRQLAETSRTFAGLGFTDNVPLRKADILTSARVRFSGSITIVGTTVRPTYAWPYNLLKRTQFKAAGVSGLIDCSGLELKAREIMRENATDRGVKQTIGSATVTQGTLSKASENWGVAPNAVATAGTYDVELEWIVPIAEDEVDLAGAIFAQTTSQDLVLSFDWNTAADLFTGTDGSNTATLTGKLIVEPTRFSIPATDHLILPDLSLFHFFVASRYVAISNGPNRVPLAGQGSNKQLLRVFGRVLSGSTPAPLAMSDDNFGALTWSYGSNETPETYAGGTSMRLAMEDNYGSDVAGVWGFFAHEFAVKNAFRDSVNMGQTSELSIGIEIPTGVALTSPALEYVQETMVQA